jgi:hypothetical protein
LSLNRLSHFWVPLQVDANTELLATTDFIEARIAKRESNYVISEQYARAACEGYTSANLPYMVAVTTITLAWALDHLGKREEGEAVRNRAYSCLKGTEDLAACGMIHFARARDLSRVDREDDALKEFATAASFLADSRYNLRRIEMDAANVEFRQSMRERERAPTIAKELSERAKRRLDHAEALLNINTLSDKRDEVRLFLARSNEALRGFAPSIERARRCSKTAYEHAQLLNDDSLMIARSQYKRAEVEYFAIRLAPEPWRVRQAALTFAIDALAAALRVQNARLKARIRILLSNLYLIRPFQDIDAADESCEAATECMSHRQDSDYLFDALTKLQSRVAKARALGGTPAVVTVTAGTAFTQSLETTLRQVEHEIVLTVRSHLGDSTALISTVLRAGHDRVEKALEFPNRLQSVPGDAPIFRVKPRTIFTQSLEATLQEVERAIVRAARARFGKDEVRQLLHMGHDRFKWHCDHGD